MCRNRLKSKQDVQAGQYNYRSIRKKIGEGYFTVIPARVRLKMKNRLKDGKAVKANGAAFLRGAPTNRELHRIVPGLGRRIGILKNRERKTGLPIVSEIIRGPCQRFVECRHNIRSKKYAKLCFAEETQETNKPILLKRGLTATIEE